MRVTILLYGVLYVVAEVMAAQFAAVGWLRLTALDVATAAANACLTVAVGIALLVGSDVYGRRWRRAMVAWREERARLDAGFWEEPATITVSSWRPEPLTLPAGPSSWNSTTRDHAVPSRDPAPGGDYAVPARGRPFPEEPGRLL